MTLKPKNCMRLIIPLLFSLSACDSSSNIDVVKVDGRDRLSDKELQQQSEQMKQNSLSLQPDTYYFGFDLRASPQEDAAQYLPFLKYLEQATGYQFKLRFTPKNSSTVDELGQNKTQFSAMGATAYLKAEYKYGAISLVRGINQQGKAEYQSVFVVRSDSRIHSIKDIKGRKLAFGNRDSTQGHLIPRIMLLENGITLSELRSYNFTGSHQNCAEAVVSGRVDVCGMQDQLAKSLASLGQIKIIHSSRYYPSSGIAVNKSVPAEVVSRVKQALLDFKPKSIHQKGLHNWDRTEMPNGFTSSKKNDYDDLRKWSIRLGFLKTIDKQEQLQ